ncbi:hypothetical protein EV401DRAFT_1922053 [Pisolithus croceorrhizus]|nr:hypothetical protein EV401DRAFT_1922053 [Pisolithus croceorrhizus]
MRQVVDVLPMFEVGSTGRTWHGKHVKEHEAPDEGSQRASDKVVEHQDLPEGSTETLEPADDISGQAGGRSMQDVPQVPSEDDQRARTNSETIVNVPDPPRTHTKLPMPHIKSSTLQNRPLARVRSATSTETDLSYTRRSGKRQKMTHLGLGSERALRRRKRTYQGRFACETPPDKAREMGVLSTPRMGWGDNADDESKTTTHIGKDLQRSLIRLRIPVVEVMMQLAGTSRTCVASRKRC